ncbi:MAG: hypothetical protein ACLQPD_24970 [Desulfomonilaceae bacterium]
MKEEPEKPCTIASNSNSSNEAPQPQPNRGQSSQRGEGFPARILKWLTNAKDSIHSVNLLLGICAIFFMAYLQWQIIGNQTDVLRNQREIAELQRSDFKRRYSPDIAVIPHRIMNPKTKVPESDELKVMNYGSAIRDFHWKAYTFVRGFVPEDEVTRREVHFVGYWNKQERTGDRTGEVVCFRGGMNFKELCELTDRVRTLCRDPKLRPLSAVTYIALWFRDRDDNPYASYFTCESSDECVNIGCEDWRLACFRAQRAIEKGQSTIRGNIAIPELLKRLRSSVSIEIVPSAACEDCAKIKALPRN